MQDDEYAGICAPLVLADLGEEFHARAYARAVGAFCPVCLTGSTIASALPGPHEPDTRDDDQDDGQGTRLEERQRYDLHSTLQGQDERNKCNQYQNFL